MAGDTSWSDDLLDEDFVSALGGGRGNTGDGGDHKSDDDTGDGGDADESDEKGDASSADE